YTRLTSSPITTTSYTDHTAAPNTGYYYRVTSVLTDGTESDGSKSSGYAAPYAGSGPIHWNFEDGTLQGWTVQPNSNFGPLITERVYYHNNPATPWNKEGKYFLSTEEDPAGNFNDAYTGVINSPSFTVTKPNVTVLVGAGSSPQTYVAACLADPTQPYGCQVVAKAQGADEEPFLYRTMDLSAYVGKSLFLQVVDESQGGWGHVTLDDVRVNYPSVPQNVLISRTDKAVNVSWDPVKDNNLAGYYVYRSTAQASGYTRLTSSPITTTSYTDHTAAPNTGYYYRVTSVLTDGTESDGSHSTAYARPYQNVLTTGSTVAYAGNKLSGIEFPVGPLGAGGILHFGDGTRNESWIFNHDDNFVGRTVGTVPNSFFAVRAATGGTTVVRALQTTAQGAFPAAHALTFGGEYPLAHYQFQDSALPVQVSEDVTNPTIPGNLKDSSIPTAIYTFTVKNPSSNRVSVSLLATQQNAVGFDGVSTIGGPTNDSYGGYKANTNTLSVAPGQGRLLMRGVPDSYGNPGAVDPNPASPKMALSMLGGGVSGTASWSGLKNLYSDFAAHGSITGPTTAASPASGTTVDGALSTTVSLAPGGQVKIPVVLSWNFPSNPRRGFGHAEGEQYTNWWPDAASVDGYTVSHLSTLLGQTQRFHDTVYKSNLPHYVLDRLTSGIAVLHTPSVFWGKNGFFGGWEGYGCCWGLPNHVWEYAQTASALWPQVGQMWTQQWLNAEQPDGLLPYRYNGDTSADPQGFGEAFDGQAGVILSAYRTYLQTGDATWLNHYWPEIQKAMDYLISQHDPDKNGLLQGAQPTTLDSSESGTGSWLGSLYLAAVNATAHMASVAGDTTAAAQLRSLYEKGRVNQEKLLWNGRYYVEKPQNLPGTVAYGPGSDIDMLLGQWWSTQLGLGDIYTTAHMNTAADNLFTNNFRNNFVASPPAGRVYVEPTDAGMVNTTWPTGAMPSNPPPYYGETWTGTEYSSAAMMIQRGQLRDGLTVVQAVADRHDGQLRSDLTLGGCATGDGGGNPFGDAECGQWYSRSMSSWSLLTALQGGTYSGARQDIGFAPQWQPANHQSFFTAGTAYGTFSQHRNAGTDTQTDRLHVVSGSLTLRHMHLAVPDSGVRNVHVRAGDQKISAGYTLTGSKVTVNISSTTVSAGAPLTITIALGHS
ncbi:MAG: GH116 family glycosyl hydrolase, partial [Solirubrobacteraceae bacterium]